MEDKIRKLWSQANVASQEVPHNHDGVHLSLMFSWVKDGLTRSVIFYQFQTGWPISIESGATHPTLPLTSGWPKTRAITESDADATWMRTIREAIDEANSFTQADLQKV